MIARRRVVGLVGGAGLVGLAVLALVALDLRGTASPPAPTAGAAPGDPAVRAAPVAAPLTTRPVPVAAADDVATPPTLPGSLEGADADGAVAADASGQLVIDLELRRLFDHFLAASGEEPIATMRARIIAALHARLPDRAATEAIAILDRYLAYRDAARNLPPTASDRAGLAQVHELRARMFSPAVARAFFADEEAATFAALDRRDVMTDPALSDAERARRVAELEARIPAAVRTTRAAAMVPLEAMDREAALRAAGASDAQITAARTETFGADGAARLAALDRTRAAWDARLARFREARATLLADATLDDAARSARLDALLAQSFTPPERIRVEAIEHLSTSP
jgi:lipase chaperone LimK